MQFSRRESFVSIRVALPIWIASGGRSYAIVCTATRVRVGAPPPVQSASGLVSVHLVRRLPLGKIAFIRYAGGLPPSPRKCTAGCTVNANELSTFRSPQMSYQRTLFVGPTPPEESAALFRMRSFASGMPRVKANMFDEM